MAKKEGKLGDALLKVALGYQIAEVTEEYAETDGELKLVKRKKTKKDIPPDLKAVQMLLSGDGGAEYGKWTDEQLEKEKQRLLKELETAEAPIKKVAEKTAKTKKTGGRVATKKKKSGSVSKRKTVKKENEK